MTADRAKFFEAMKKIYSVKNEAGRALYGDRFRSSEDLLAKHLNGAGTSDCDHWHDGAAIVSSTFLCCIHSVIKILLTNGTVDTSRGVHFRVGTSPTIHRSIIVYALLGVWHGQVSLSLLLHRISCLRSRLVRLRVSILR